MVTTRSVSEVRVSVCVERQGRTSHYTTLRIRASELDPAALYELEGQENSDSRGLMGLTSTSFTLWLVERGGWHILNEAAEDTFGMLNKEFEHGK